jgi:hypothetical protein
MSHRIARINYYQKSDLRRAEDFLKAARRSDVEKVYGRRIPAEVWSGMKSLTRTWVTFASLERRSLPVKVVRKKLNIAVSATKKLREEFGNRSSIDKEPLQLDPAWIYRKYFQNSDRLFPRNEIYWLLTYAIDAFLAVATLVQTKMDEPDQQAEKEGLAWNAWSFQLGQLFQEHGLPISIRKDTQKRKPNIPPSPFVLLVAELQKHLPPDFRRFVHSTQALEEGLYRARRYLSARMVPAGQRQLVGQLPDGQYVLLEVVDS